LILVRPRSALAAGALLAAVSGCSPCFGVVDCVEGPHASASGHIAFGETGELVPGARVTIVVTHDGVADSGSAVSDAHGDFDVSARTTAAAGGRISLRVQPPELPGYSIDSLSCSVTRIRGDGCILDPVVPAPWMPYLIRVVYRGSLEPAGNVKIRFTRTGGSEWVGPAASTSATLSGTTDANGAIPMLPTSLFTSSMAPVSGDMVIDLPEPYGTSVQHDYPIRPTYLVNDRQLMLVEAGPALGYAMVFVDSATSAPLPNVSVTFTRESGIAVTPNPATVHSGPDGRAALPVRPLATGAVTGSILIQPQGRQTTTLSAQTLATFESDSTRILARWKVGATGLLYPTPP
jgi:hypothetical protein